ncbi:conserved hypothetical protein [Ricinus communis]|uniref:Uncharacterized protein n=1 Tax=Ricinus communis TaxID=3988 RepID=B9RE11_RICCO|nr:conserved hypothetical protein [Ricinus communis]
MRDSGKTKTKENPVDSRKDAGSSSRLIKRRPWSVLYGTVVVVVVVVVAAAVAGEGNEAVWFN